MKILLVDDSEDVRRAMRSVIEQNPKSEVCIDNTSSHCLFIQSKDPTSE